LTVAVLATGIGLWLRSRAGCDRPDSSAGILHPPDGAVLPPDMAAPTFIVNAARSLTVRVGREDGGEAIEGATREGRWRPSAEAWARLAKGRAGAAFRVELLDSRGRRQAASRFSISRDPVAAPLIFREVILPFAEAVKDPSRIAWRFGSVGTHDPPPVVLSGLPVCGNCHSFSADGSVLGMDVDYANDKGSYAIVPVAADMALTRDAIITWSDYRREDGQLTFGLLSQVSPDGRYAISTVKDRSIFMVRDDIFFSQLFFPIKGILAVYDRETRSFAPLPGADDPRYVQSNAAWSPDGRFVLFARAPARDLKNLKHPETALITAAEAEVFFRDNPTFRYDLYRVPFNAGKGGAAEPVKGASGDGRSNFFGRYSPDGRWIVFCKAASFMLLRADSRLYVVPAEGGEPRPLAANTSRMNSWHTFSPNGRWLAFASKEWGPYTRVCLTHFDEQARTTPPVTLFHLTSPDRAANIPEFVNLPDRGIARIRESFMDDASYLRAGTDLFNGGDAIKAEAAFRRSLGLNPSNSVAHYCLGNTLALQGRFAEAERLFRRASELAPGRGEYLFGLGKALREQKRAAEARETLEAAVRVEPDHAGARAELGRALYDVGAFDAAAAALAEAAKRLPSDVTVRYSLAVALYRSGDAASARREAEAARDLAAAAGDRATVRQVEALLTSMGSPDRPGRGE
jgi:tetratricopeptide (TPR) repeat protein